MEIGHIYQAGQDFPLLNPQLVFLQLQLVQLALQQFDLRQGKSQAFLRLLDENFDAFDLRLAVGLDFLGETGKVKEIA